MKIFLKVIFWTFWLVLGFIFHGVFFSYLNDKDMMLVFIVLLVLWWGITAVISLVKWKKYRKENPALTRDQKQKRKQIQKDIAYRNSREFKKKYYSDVEIENSYFGNGVLVKDSSSENICYKDIKSGFDRLFDSFGKKSGSPCDLHEFCVEEENIEYVLASLEKIYKSSDKIMEGCYSEIYKEITGFFEDNCGENLKSEFNLDYLKENWYVSGLAVYDDHAEFAIGINAAEDPEHDSYYDIYVFVDYSKQEAEVSFNVVW